MFNWLRRKRKATRPVIRTLEIPVAYEELGSGGTLKQLDLRNFGGKPIEVIGVGKTDGGILIEVQYRDQVIT